MENDYRKFAIKTLLMALLGLSIMPILACVVGYLDKEIRITVGGGYYTNVYEYILEWPLKPLLVYLILLIIISCVYLYIYNRKKHAHKEDDNEI